MSKVLAVIDAAGILGMTGIVASAFMGVNVTTIAGTTQATVNYITGTTRQPTCLQLEEQYGDDGLCATRAPATPLSWQPATQTFLEEVECATIETC